MLEAVPWQSPSPTRIPIVHDEGESFSFKAGAKIGDLTLIRELGRGGQAVVFEARQETLDRRVAVKILSRDYVNSDSQAAQVQARSGGDRAAQSSRDRCGLRLPRSRRPPTHCSRVA